MLDVKMLFLVLPMARDAVGLYVKHTKLMSVDDVTWKSYDNSGYTRVSVHHRH